MNTLTGESLFFTLAALGLALTGFIGLVSAFRLAEQKTFSPQQFNGMKLMLEHTLAATSFALLPPILFYTSWAKPYIWRISSCGLAGFFLFEILIQIYRRKKFTAMGYPPTFPKLLLYEFLPITGFFAIINLTNVFRWNGLSSCIWSLFWLLTISVRQFLILVLVGSPTPTMKKPSS